MHEATDPDGGALLRERLTAAFGQASVEASTLREVVKSSGETVLRCGRVEVALGEDGRLWVVAVRAGVQHVAVLDDDRLVWVARRSIAPPTMN